MEAFDVLGDPVRRRLIELIAEGERAAGELARTVGEEFGISQPAVSQHLKVLRDNGFATVRVDGARRLYRVTPAPLEQVVDWVDDLRRAWEQRLDALGTELARGRRARRTQDDGQKERGQKERGQHNRTQQDSTQQEATG